jgi:hypothetical protein
LTDQLLGPLAALALALVVLGLFQSAKILPRNTVPRESVEKQGEINASLVEGLKSVTTALNVLVAVVRHQQQQNGGL